MKHRPPKWYHFNGWVFLGALAGLGIAFVLFCTVQWWLFGKFTFRNQAPNDPTLSAKDVISMTATAIGGFTIGGVAVMQFRKHKWAEYQAAHSTKLEEKTKTSERLGKAIEHLSVENLHSRLGAIHEFKNLADDSPTHKECIVQILTAYINVFTKKYTEEEWENFSEDIWTAARVLSQLTRELIEETSEKATKGKIQRPPQCVFDATEVLSGFATEKDGKLINAFIQWAGLKAACLNICGIILKGAGLERTNLRNTYLGGAHLEGANLSEARLDSKDRYDIDSRRYHLYKTNLRRVNLEGANLKGTIFLETHLEGADFRGARLLSYSNKVLKVLADFYFIRRETHFEIGWLRLLFDTTSKAHIDANTQFDPDIREKYFPEFGKEKEEDPDHPED